jgi:pantothenate synthetase
VVDAATFRPLTRIAGEVVLPVAARFGATRLIDNFRLEVN